MGYGSGRRTPRSNCRNGDEFPPGELLKDLHPPPDNEKAKEKKEQELWPQALIGNGEDMTGAAQRFLASSAFKYPFRLPHIDESGTGTSPWQYGSWA